MNNTILEEGNLLFSFSGYLDVEKFDDQNTNLHGLLPVDFVAETSDKLCFIEVKDYQHPHPMAVAKRETNRQMLLTLVSKKDNDEECSLYCHKIGSKFKDSLLRKYASGKIDKEFKKEIIYIFFVNFDVLGANERGMLKEKISKHVPRGLKDSRRGLLPDMSFDLVNMDQLKNYGIFCTAKP